MSFSSEVKAELAKNISDAIVFAIILRSVVKKL